MGFKERVFQHLSDYRENEMGISDMGDWRNTPRGHILPPELANHNILPDYREKFLNSDMGKIKRHLYFHHLNSSQAMCINFFFPLYAEHHLESVTECFGFQGEEVDYQSVQFEKESSIDGTNFDFYFKTASGKRFFFEIKYTEDGFGSAKDDVEHREKYKRVYEPRLGDKVQQEYSSMDMFFKKYQIIRNLVHISEDSYIAFLYPEENIKVAMDAKLAKNRIATHTYSENVISITWEDILFYLCDKPIGEHVKKYLSEFHEKYLVCEKE